MYNRARFYALYGQDSWRATRNLTLNYGLRWEVSSPWWETHNEQRTLVPGLQSEDFPGAPTGWVFPGDPGIPSTLSPTRHGNFAPRLGLAYSPSATEGLLAKLLGGPGKTSIRTAFGIYYTSWEDRMISQEAGNAPYGYWWSSPTPPMFANPYIDRSTGYNEGERFPITLPPLNTPQPKDPDNSINWAQFEPITSSPTWYYRNRLPYGEHYDFSVQRQFGGATLLSVSYVGTQGHRLLATVENNPGNPALCLSLSQPNEVTNGVTCGPYGENNTYSPVTGGVITTTRTTFGPAFGSNGWMATMANSNYNALEVTMRHTVGGLKFLAGYTFSKSLDNASGNGLGQGDNINPINPKITKSLSAFDVPNNFVTSYNYRVPFYKLWSANRLTNGWTLSGIMRFATGFPVYIFEPDDNSLLGTFSSGQGNPVDEPNRLPGSLNITDPRKADPSAVTNPYFNPALFTHEAIGQLGNSSRRFFHGPGWNNWDMALVKELHLTESKNLQFRAEFFNMFNHAQFGGPDGNIDSGSTFGFVTSAGAARIGQVAMKFIW
jgi:hypothetical protein